ncbi:hypothetical protein DL95DRAFT_387671, partial [Leptodontidium sp. 2 PMI_412]
MKILQTKWCGWVAECVWEVHNALSVNGRLWLDTVQHLCVCESTCNMIPIQCGWRNSCV